MNRAALEFGQNTETEKPWKKTVDQTRAKRNFIIRKKDTVGQKNGFNGG